MLLKYIQHFVNPEGRDFFPQWFASTTEKMQALKGFITAHYILDPVDLHKVHFFMYFDDAAALERWAATPAHEAALKALSAYWVKPYVMQQAVL